MFKSELNDISELGQQVVGNMGPSAQAAMLIGHWSQSEPGASRSSHDRSDCLNLESARDLLTAGKL